MTKPDLRNANKAPVFPAPMSASAAPGLSGRPPLPAGKPMILKRVSPGERAVLQRYGWKDGDPVPDDLAMLIDQEALATTKEATDRASMPPPVDLKTPKLKLPEEQELSPEEQIRYAEVIASLQRSKEEYAQENDLAESYVEANQSVNSAIAAAASDRSEVEIEPTSNKKETEHTNTGNCPHCSWDLSQPSLAEPSEDDKINYMQTFLGDIPFSKDFTLLGGRLHVRLRSLTTPEQEMCLKQATKDIQSNKDLENPAMAIDLLWKYSLAVQLVSLKGPGLALDNESDLTVFQPDANGDFAVKDALEKLMSKISHGGMYRVLIKKMSEFNAIVKKMEDNVDNENFWKAIS